MRTSQSVVKKKGVCKRSVIVRHSKRMFWVWRWEHVLYWTFKQIPAIWENETDHWKQWKNMLRSNMTHSSHAVCAEQNTLIQFYINIALKMWKQITKKFSMECLLQKDKKNQIQHFGFCCFFPGKSLLAYMSLW